VNQPTTKLTPAETRVAVTIRDFRHDCGVSPTFDQIADLLGCSKTTVFGHVRSLRRKGAIRLQGPRTWNTLELTDAAALPPVDNATKLILLGDADRSEPAAPGDVILAGFLPGTSLMTRFRRLPGMGVVWLSPEFIPPRPCDADRAVRLGVAAARAAGRQSVIVEGTEHLLLASSTMGKGAA
jgi:hypothetical protein